MLLKKRNSNDYQKALPLEKCFAKSIKDVTGESKPGLSVEAHCIVVGLVAREIIIRRSRFAGSRDIFPPGSELIAAVHDVGKINPDFQRKIYESSGQNTQNIDALKDADPMREKDYGYHSAVSQAALEETSRIISKIVGKHHGFSPLTPPLASDEVIGGTVWQAVREQLINRLKDCYSCEWPVIQSDDHAKALALAGLTTVSDWIGSGPVFEAFTHLPPSELKKYVDEALDKSGFIQPELVPDLTFSQIFNGYTPRPVQQKLISMVDSPGVYVLEALMGEGKTEAALFAAYQLITRGQASGIYFALPTRLTSEKIHERMDQFLQKILKSKSPLLLAHGEAWLKQTDMGEEGSPGYSWFNAKKRALLAPFAVGTIDQALMSVMNVKHGFVRAFGLTGKVVILDEVHSYDAYTGSIMEKLIATLRELGSTVILLSATLSGDRRRSLLPVKDINKIGKAPPQLENYPLITKFVTNGNISFSECLNSNEKKISLCCTADEVCITKKVRNKLFDGEYVLWIENIVNEAQEIYKTFAAWGKENGIEVGLLHSRFPGKTRIELEDHWVDLFGKQGVAKRNHGGKLLIGTQVLEQSLDIDADFLVTRLAPTDMILQRIGRVWRHSENTRPTTAKPEVTVIVPERSRLSGKLDHAFGSSGKVYAPYVLARSFEVLEKHSRISIPEDLRNLIEDTYKERCESEFFQIAKKELQLQKEKLERFAVIGVASQGQTLPESAPTRYSDLIYCDVLLLEKEVRPNDEVVYLYNGESIYINQNGDYKHHEKKEHIQILRNLMFSVPQHIAPDPISIKEMKWVRPFIFVSDNEDERLRIAILEQTGEIKGFAGKQANEKYLLRFSSELGFSAQKRSINGKSF